MAFAVPGKQGDLGLIIFLLKAADINAEQREGSEEQREIRCYINFRFGMAAYLVSTKQKKILKYFV